MFLPGCISVLFLTAESLLLLLNEKIRRNNKSLLDLSCSFVGKKELKIILQGI